MSSKNTDQIGNALVEEIKKWPRAVGFKINKKAIIVDPKSSIIKLDCTPSVRLSSTFHISKKGVRISQYELKTEIWISAEQEIPDNDPVGVITFYHAIISDGIPDGPDKLVIKLVSSPSSFDFIYRTLFADKISASLCTVDILGLGESDGEWDVSESYPRLLIKDFRISAEGEIEEECQDSLILKSLDERIGRIEEKLSQGIKINLF
jgi:hypothetical protein